MPQTLFSTVPCCLTEDSELLSELRIQLERQVPNYAFRKGHAADRWVEHYLDGGNKPGTNMTTTRYTVRMILRTLLKEYPHELTPRAVHLRLGMS